MTEAEQIRESVMKLRHSADVLMAMSPKRLMLNVNVLDLKNALTLIEGLKKFKDETEDELELLREAVKAKEPKRSLTCLRMLPTNVTCDEKIPCPHHGTEFAEIPQ